MSTLRFVLFFTVFMGVWAAMHAFVFWRLAAVPVIAAHVPGRAWFWTAVALWISYPLARSLNAWGLAAVGEPLEMLAANWVGVLFLLFAALLVADAITLGGTLAPRLSPVVRGWAAVVALALAAIALVQGLRAPVVRDYKVRMAGLPPARDGLVLVTVSDLHLGTLIGRRWMARLVGQVDALKPDLVMVAGDLVDGEVGRLKGVLPVLQTLRAPLGVWAVTGNHEYYAGLERSVRLLRDAGYTVLRDEWREVAPGLVLAGVDDLTARRQNGRLDRPVERTLEGRPPGATVLLSHSPLQAEVAAAGGVGLMLSGHTHNGQIWPFNYAVRSTYRLMGGRYDVRGMTAIVCRGTGTWGPRMRLWRPGEILRIRLRCQD